MTLGPTEKKVLLFTQMFAKGVVKKKDKETLLSNPERLKRHKLKKALRNRKHKAKKRGRRANDWDSVLSRIKEKIEAEDWQILTKRLTECNLVPASLQPPIEEIESVPWKHTEIDFLHENSAYMLPSAMAERLKRTTKEVVRMLAKFDLPTIK